jgi:hypothetical protein
LEGISAKEKTMDVNRLLQPWFLGSSYDERAEVVYGPYDDDDELVSFRVFELREAPYTETLVIWFNERLLTDPAYEQRVICAAQRQQPDIWVKAEEARLTLTDVVILYLAMCVEYGHIDQKTAKPVRISDWSTYAGEMMWIQTFGEVESLIDECGSTQQPTCSEAKQEAAEATTQLT